MPDVDPNAFLEAIADDEGRAGSLTSVRTLHRVPARIQPFPPDLPELVVDRLGLLGIEGLYPHQADALRRVRAGHDVIVATGTASGKTLVGNLAFASNAVEGSSKATALYLFPTKALARDQLRQVRSLRLPQVRAAVYDGDTLEARASPDPAEREPRHDEPGHAARPPPARPSALVGDFLLRLSLVVVDEAHVAPRASSGRTSPWC